MRSASLTSNSLEEADLVAARPDRLAEVEVHAVGRRVEFGGEGRVVGALKAGPDCVAHVGVERESGLQAAVVNATAEPKMKLSWRASKANS